MSFSYQAAVFVQGLRAETLPERIVSRARVLLLNGYALGLGGRDLPIARIARGTALRHGHQDIGGATLWGTPTRIPLAAAIQANAALLHARVQDDTNGASHFGVVLIPLLSALAEAGAALDGFLPALVAGYEVGGLLDKCLGQRTAARGFRGTMLFGTVAAAAAAARLMQLTVAQSEAAIAMAASMTGGLTHSFSEETDEWRLQPGLAASTGLFCAMHAAAGAQGSRSVFMARGGYADVFAGDESLLTDAASDLGRVWSVEQVAFKPFPVAMFNQAVVLAAQQARAELRGQEPAHMTVTLNPFEARYPGIADRGPFQSASGALMSAPVCAALTLAEGEPTLAKLSSPGGEAVRRIAAVTEVRGDPTVARLSCRLTIECRDGRRLEANATAPDSKTFDMSCAVAVLRSICAHHQIAHEAADLLTRMVENLPAADITDLAKAFALPAEAQR